MAILDSGPSFYENVALFDTQEEAANAIKEAKDHPEETLKKLALRTQYRMWYRQQAKEEKKKKTGRKN